MSSLEGYFINYWKKGSHIFCNKTEFVLSPCFHSFLPPFGKSEVCSQSLCKLGAASNWAESRSLLFVSSLAWNSFCSARKMADTTTKSWPETRRCRSVTAAETLQQKSLAKESQCKIAMIFKDEILFVRNCNFFHFCSKMDWEKVRNGDELVLFLCNS